MRELDTEGICLKASPFEEAHLIVTFYTADWGIVRAVAKGVKKPGSKLIGACEPLTLNRLVLMRGSGLYRLKTFDRRESFPTMRDDLARMSAGLVMADVLRLVGREEDSDSTVVYAMLSEALAGLNDENMAWESVSINFHRHLMAVSGYDFPMLACIQCDAPLNPETRPYYFFSTADGGMVCPDCEAHRFRHQGVKVSTPTLVLLDNPAQIDPGANGEKAHRFLAYLWHHRLDKEVGSFKVLFQLLESLSPVPVVQTVSISEPG